MRLTSEQKLAVAMARGAADLVRVGDRWCAVWHEAEQPPAERWRGQMVTQVDEQERAWFRPEVFGRTRREVVTALSYEV